MNILVLSWRDPKHPLAGGAEQVMHEHMKGWVARGHKVILFSSRIKGFKNKEVIDGVEIFRRGDQYFGVKIAAIFYYFFNKTKIDFVVDQFHGIPFFSPLYIKKPKLAVVQEVARKVWLLNELSAPFNWIIGFFGLLFEPAIFLLYKRVPFMVGSESAKKDLIKFKIPSDNINVVPHGVIIQRPSPFPPKEKIKTIMFLGALAKDKGIEDALKTFALLNKHGEFKFWIVGRGSSKYQKYLQGMCGLLNISKQVKFWGYVDDKKKFELLAKAHLLFNPSVHEGWGLVNIEANAVGTPVVAYNSAGLVDSVKDGFSGIIIKGNSSKEASLIISNILKDEKTYEKMRQNAVVWSKNFSCQKSRELSLGLINKYIHQ